MTVKAHLDIESFSKEDLKKAGTYRYAEHSSTEILCLFYCFDDGPVNGWVPYGSIPKEAYPDRNVGRFYVQPDMPDDLRQHVESGGEIRAHNCVTGDHEVRTRDGWARLDELKDGVEVLQWDAETSALKYVTPSAVIRKDYTGRLLCWDSSYHKGQYTPDHNFIYCTKDTRGVWRKDKLQFVVNSNHPNNLFIPVTGVLQPDRDKELTEVNPDIARFLEMVRADFYLPERSISRGRFSKERKIHRAKELLNKIGAKHTMVVDPEGVTAITIKDQCLLGLARRLLGVRKEKRLGSWVLDLSVEARLAWLDESRFWDGNVRSNDQGRSQTQVCSAKEEDAYWLQEMAVLTGMSAKAKLNYPNVRGFSRKDSVLSRVSIRDRNSVKTLYPPKVEQYSGKVYCLTVPSGAFLVRRQGATWVTGNCNFERVMLTGKPGEKIGWPPTRAEQWVCTAVKAASHGLPRDLDRATNAAAPFCDSIHPKDKTGHGVMLQVARPRKPSKDNAETRYTPWNAPDKFKQLYNYCADDVRAERSLDHYLADISPREQAAYLLDQAINDRGVQVDLETVEHVQVLLAEYKGELEDRCRQLTGGVNPTQTAQLADWIRAQGFDIDNLQAPTVAEALKRDDVPKNVRQVLKIRSLHAMKAVSKYAAMQRAVCRDGRLRGMFIFYGAGATGRFSSKYVQLQNMHRGYIKDPDAAVEAYRAQTLEWLRFLYDVDPMKVFASTVRACLVAAPGKELICSDYKQIEARVLPWFAGQNDVLDVFRSGEDIYRTLASKMYGVPADRIDDSRRFQGKVAGLSCQYQGWSAALMKMARNYGADFDEDQAAEIAGKWREANPKIVAFWYAMEEAAKEAIRNPGGTYGVADNKIMFRIVGDFLVMRLPSGRRLYYFRPELRIDKQRGREQITFLGIDTYTRQWCRTTTYGGSLAQSATQAAARDIMVNGMFNLAKAGYDLIGTVHDEVWNEVDEGEGSIEEVERIMCVLPDWARDIPIEAQGYRAKRYKKD